MIYFIANTHFCHSNTIGSYGQLFENADGMDRALIDNWNSCVTDRDEIYILSDFLYKGKDKDANNTLSKLKGYKYLIVGNHEKYPADSELKPEAFEWINYYK